MKARHIAKLRRKIQQKDYIVSRLNALAKECEKWHTFFICECYKPYVGEEKAYLNTLIYNKHGKRYKGKFDWYKKKLEKEQ